MEMPPAPTVALAFMSSILPLLLARTPAVLGIKPSLAGNQPPVGLARFTGFPLAPVIVPPPASGNAANEP